ncbi:elongation factor 4 [Acidaminobacter sp. JC074]|uniref:translation elongation factor 4 n=1 Tax=Acidaminobacter sp. JC074 TaxID=2530199 RepID=UPI001F0FEF13|nr:translation elongation factor 4 [Acidaminobacter sp. JC074]MCH4887740.1 elongation factor 4 [Acidaminobacter sp. JC074]
MSSERQSKIRNFCIIAHIDHGKSTLADRLIQNTGALTEREMKEQILDTMELERERGITIKLQTTRLNYTAKDGETYTLNLIDTPGHVDFTYEVSRSLAACEGAVLVVDAAQGVEAQTLANVYLADEQGLEMLPVLNKIDLPAARPEEIIEEIEDIVGIPADHAPRISAKNNVNIGEVLEQIVTELPAPNGDEKAPLKALIFDSIYDQYKGAIAYVRVVDGSVKKGDEIIMMSTGNKLEVVEVGICAPNQVPVKELKAGDVGYVTASIKNVRDCQVGDTITSAKNPTKEPMPGYKEATSMVYCGVYPAEGESFELIRDALDKLRLNDAALSFEPETSLALGYGFRCGFLGLLHMEIIQQRLLREFDLDIITTAPGVIYKVTKTSDEVVYIQNPANLPEQTEIKVMEEPIVKADIIVPNEFVGNVMELCQDRRGVMLTMDYIDSRRVILHYDLPLNEVIYDFFDALKSKTKGYGSLDYEFKEYVPSDLVKMDILLNKELIDAFSLIVHKTKAESRGRQICDKLKDVIPRHMFAIPVQAAIGNKVIARETIKAMRKDVLAKCYGGDISRKKKLLEKQKEGKKKMRSLGSVDVPQEAFLAVLKFDDK